MKIARLLQKILPPIWFGMICAIAMEAQLKFQAPGITRELGLGIGKLVFTALNRVEIVIAVLLLLTFLMTASTLSSKIIFGLIFVILSVQSLWLMPVLIERIDLITSGQNPSESSIHIFYIAFEICKLCLLLVLSILLNSEHSIVAKELLSPDDITVAAK